MPPRKASIVVKLKQMRLQDLPKRSRILINGPSGSGKTTLLAEIVDSMAHHFHSAYLFTAEQDNIDKFRGIIPRWHMTTDVKETFLANLYDKKDKANRERAERGEEKKDWLLILDDVAFAKEFMRSETMDKIFFNSRHAACTIIVLLQYINAATPAVRDNANFVFSFWVENAKTRKGLYDNYFSCLEGNFNATFAHYTQDRGAIVVDKSNVSARNVSDRVFWYKTKPFAPPSFSIGSKSAFALDKCFVEHPEDADDEQDSSSSGVTGSKRKRASKKNNNSGRAASNKQPRVQHQAQMFDNIGFFPPPQLPAILDAKSQRKMASAMHGNQTNFRSGSASLMPFMGVGGGGSGGSQQQQQSEINLSDFDFG